MVKKNEKKLRRTFYKTKNQQTSQIRIKYSGKRNRHTYNVEVHATQRQVT